jgi:predicted O-linked N-acetylglucosamine transferase (SPINDLY family)
MTARNSPCPCGSGKKFKNCHGQQADSGARTPRQSLRESVSLFEQGRIDEALALARQAPDSSQRSRLLVRILISARDPARIKQALKIIDKWKRSDRANPEPWQRQVEISLFKKDLKGAKQAFSEMSRRAPRHPNVMYYKGIILQLSGRSPEAHEAYREGVMLQQASKPASSALDRKTSAVYAAIQLCETAVGSYPGSDSKDDSRLFDHADALEIMESCLRDWEDARDSSSASTPEDQINDCANAWYNLGCAYMGAFTGSDKRLELFRKAYALNPQHELARYNELLSLNYSVERTPREIFDAHLKTGRFLLDRQNEETRAFRNSPDPDRPLRIAYLSSDFRYHSVSFFIQPVLDQHDPDRVRTFLYYNKSSEDERTQFARRSAHKFRKVAKLGDDELARQIVEDGIDILVDLNGPTEHGRFSMLARRLAPVQVSWIGYPNTTGLETVDYRIVDEITNPPPGAQELVSEHLLYMPKVFSVFQAAANLPPVGVAPSRKNGFVTFGSFNAMQKLNDPLLDCWAAILNGVPASRILVKNGALAYKTPGRKLIEAFRKRGIDPDRIELAGRTADNHAHLEYYQKADISLDSFPYNGTTTTCDSLIMGVPPVTCAGGDHRSRVSASLLHCLELDSLVASDEKGYVEIATQLAQSPDRLQSLRDGLRERMQASPLMDAAGFTRELESVYHRIWVQWCENHEQNQHRAP